MRTELECMVCFMRQALSAARLSTTDSAVHRLVVNETGRLLPRLEMASSPPENAVAVYRQIADLTGVEDPFAKLKNQSNVFALRLRDEVCRQIENADDSLYAAIRYAIAGNIIDYGAQHRFNAMHSLSECLEKDLCIDEFELLRREVQVSKRLNILYLADNCGEIVFDSLLVEQLVRPGHDVTLVVRSEEILNDATMRDAIDAGLDRLCKVMDNGSSCPGTPLGSCSHELRQAFASADLIISKGQGNFETLSEVDRAVYFLLTVKCQVVARHIAALKKIPQERIPGGGEMVLMKKEARNAQTAD